MIDEQTVSRRGMLITASAGVGGLVLAGCASSSGEKTPSGAAATSTADGPSPVASSSPTAPSTRAADGATSGAQALVALADVPVGGAVSATGAAGAKLLVSQPTKGKVVAFDSTCTHMGCTVAPGKGGLDCPCHGSVYDLATGVPTKGPATKPLAKVQVSVVSGQVVLTS